ncbi:MAG TPA: glycosyltransferase family 2 protein [Hanamia sp.]
MVDTPLVSVLMTSYNREQYIAEAIESVLASTFKNFELLIVDDCSTDKTVEIAKSYEAKDNRVKVFVNEKNLAQFGNRNKAASYSSGYFLKYFDSDDIMNPNCLEVMVNAMQEYPEAGVVSQTNDPWILENSLCRFYTSRECYINHYFNGNTVLYSGPSGCMFKRKVFEELGGFDEKIGILSDTLLMFKIAAAYPVIGVRNDLFYWRRHEGQVTIGQLNWFEMVKQRFEINQIALHSGNLPLTKKEQKTIFRNVKNILARRLIRTLIAKQNFREFLKLISICNLKFPDFIKATIKNKRLNNPLNKNISS